MIIKEIQAGPHVGVEVTDNVLTLTGEHDFFAVDLVTEQGDSQVILDITLDGDGKMVRGLGQAYVASVLIPPAEYREEPTGEVDADGNAVVERVKCDLAIGAVELKLWRYEKNTNEEVAE